ncbi:hypothetical protein RRG08_002333 [Elysia crispata]|uniref:Uncharacterized protein n=1 Tax=Elysia crispata TaxID=231223 RepID=A0AAE0ZBZ8_9GAST|nr:hypothetical protein RRG08_002333 [Elysia crispata]
MSGDHSINERNQSGRYRSRQSRFDTAPGSDMQQGNSILLSRGWSDSQLLCPVARTKEKKNWCRQRSQWVIRVMFYDVSIVVFTAIKS